MKKRLRPSDMTKRERDVKLAAFLDMKRGRPAIKPAPRAARSVAKVMRPLAKKMGPSAGGLASNWPDIVGIKYARVSRPLRLQGSKDGSTLIISARGPAATLLQADGARIISAVNTYLGQGHVVRLKVVQGQMSAPAAPANVQSGHVPAKTKKPQTAPGISKRGLTASETDRLQNGLADVSNDALRKALEDLGRGVYGRQP